MPYIGHNPTNSGTFYILDSVTLGNSAGPYNLTVGGVSVTPKVDNLLIMLDGVVQHAGDAYTISGNQITFSAATASGMDFYGIIMGQAASFAQGSIGADELKVADDGSANQVLVSDGDGTFSWVSQSALTPSANLVTGATLKSTVTASSLTSVGTLTSLTSSGQILTSDGTAGAPSYSFSTDPDTGIYWGGTNAIGFVTGGTSRLEVRADGNSYFAGTVNVPEYINHSGDTDTHFRFSADDAIEITAGNVKMMRFLEDGSQDMVVINEDAADIDFRIESASNTHAFFVEGSSGNIGIGTSSPTSDALLHIKKDQSAYTRFIVENTTNSSATQALGSFISNAGTLFMGITSTSHSATGDAIINQTASGKGFKIIVGGSDRMKIANNGQTTFAENVGIGNFSDGTVHTGTTPDERLQIVKYDVSVDSTVHMLQKWSTGFSGSEKGSNFGIGLSRYQDPGNNYPRTKATFYTTGRTNDSDAIPTAVMSINDSGNFVTSGTHSPGGSPDYAEYFESKDGKAIPFGTSVKLDGDKIVPCESGDIPIGVISADPSFIAGGAEFEWKQRWLVDAFGKKLIGEDGNEIENPDYDDTIEYIPRDEREEWNVVGIMGQLPVTKGQPIASNWIKMKDISDTVELWFIK